MSARVSLFMRATRPTLGVGIAVAAGFIAVETLVIYPLRSVVSDVVACGVIYLVGVFVVSIVWGVGLGAATAVASAAAFDFFHIPPTLSLATSRSSDWVALTVFLVVALMLGSVAELARSRATEADERRAKADRLADEQAALHRVAMLVARGVPPTHVFAAAATEVGQLLAADATRLLRYDDDGTAVDVAGPSELDLNIPGAIGDRRYKLERADIAGTVLRTGRPARIENYEGAPGAVAAALREHGVRCSVGAPVVVEGRLWGVMISVWTQDRAVSADTEERMVQFTELVATAIANASTRAELDASRARLVTAFDEARRRLVRDLHDGAQQRLVHTTITLKLAQRALGNANGPAADLLNEALDHAQRANAELRDLAHGILPTALSSGGMRAAIETLVARLRLPVSVEVTSERFTPALEATAYFIVAEALTNTVKHAHASGAEVGAVADGGVLRIEVRDDGVGGAGIEGSTGLLGLRDRAAALNGSLDVESPQGGGTVVVAKLPIVDSN